MSGISARRETVRPIGGSWALLAALALSPDPAFAQPAALTLAQAQQAALAHNPDLRTAAAQADAAAAQARAAREFPNPTLSVATAKIATDGSGNGTLAGNRFFERSYDSIVALNQLIEIGKRGPRQASSSAGRRLAEAQQDDVRRLILLSVSQAYIAALEAREESRVLAASAASLRRETELSAARLAAGDIATRDRAQIAIAAGQMDLEAAAARHTATTAIVILETLLGLSSPAGTTELVDPLDAMPLPSASPEEAPNGTRPDVAAAEAGVAKATADLQLQKHASVPDITVSLQFERNPPDQPNTAGIGLSFPLPIWNRNAGAIRTARAARTVAEIQLDKTRVQAAAELATSRSAFREARERLAAYRDTLQPQSAAAVRTIAYAYEHGGASLIALLTAERDDNEVRLATVRAQADAASAAFALFAALNRPFP